MWVSCVSDVEDKAVKSHIQLVFTLVTNTPNTFTLWHRQQSHVHMVIVEKFDRTLIK